MFARAARCYMCVILCPDAFNVGRVPKIGNVASWSIGMNMVFKFTCDAARLMNAPKLFKVCTTCIIQYLGNVENRGSFRGLVRYMATTPQSCIKALVVRIWFGKDDKANVRAARATASHSAYRVLTSGLCTQVTAHVVPIMEEAAHLEGKRGGIELDAVMERAPFTYERAGLHKDEQGVDLPRAKGKLHMRPLEKLPGTKVNMHKGHARECLVTKVRILPFFFFCFDGATTMAITGVSLQSRTPDPFTTVNKDEMGRASMMCGFFGEGNQSPMWRKNSAQAARAGPTPTIG